VPFFGFLFNTLKSAPVILSLGDATLASFFCFGEYFLKGIIYMSLLFVKFFVI
jgi:hypothetical protein